MVLFLGRDDSPVLAYLKTVEPELEHTDRKVDLAFVQKVNPAYLVCDRYRFILTKDVVAEVRGRAVNTHISLLPWNRGADPNFWSFFDDTPKGSSIHFLDEGVDTGPLIARREMNFDPAETLVTTYDKLRELVVEIFVEYWPQVRAGTVQGVPQEHRGTYHQSTEIALFRGMLSKGWDTTVGEVAELGRKWRELRAK